MVYNLTERFPSLASLVSRVGQWAMCTPRLFSFCQSYLALYYSYFVVSCSSHPTICYNKLCRLRCAANVAGLVQSSCF